MPKNTLNYDTWAVSRVYSEVGEDVAPYAVYHRGRKVLQIEPVGRLDNLYRLHYGRNDSTVVDKHTHVQVGV